MSTAHKVNKESTDVFDSSHSERELFDKVCEVSKEKLTPHEKAIERLWLGGDRHVLNGFLNRCPWLLRFADRTAEHRLNIPTPDRHGLTKSIDEALSYRVVRLPRDPGAA